MRTLRRMFAGERRHRPRHDAEHVRVTNELAELKTIVARRHGTTPEQLFDYTHADRILGRR